MSSHLAVKCISILLITLLLFIEQARGADASEPVRQSKKTIRIGIVPFSVSSKSVGYNWLGAGVAEAVAYQLRYVSDKITVIESERLQKILKSSGIKKEEAEAINIQGQMDTLNDSSVDYLVTGSVQLKLREGTGKQDALLTCTVIKTDGGAYKELKTAEGTLGIIFSLINELAVKIAASAGFGAAENEECSFGYKGICALSAFESYSLGMEHFHQKRYDRARDEFRKACHMAGTEGFLEAGLMYGKAMSRLAAESGPDELNRIRKELIGELNEASGPAYVKSYFQGELYSLLGRMAEKESREKALEYYERAVESYDRALKETFPGVTVNGAAEGIKGDIWASKFKDGVLHMAMRDPSIVYAMDARSGRILWSTSSEIKSRMGAIEVSDGTLYVATCSPVYVYAFNAKSGHLLWSTEGKREGVGYISEIRAFNDSIYINADQIVYLLNRRTGALLLDTDRKINKKIFACEISGSTLFAITYPSSLCAFNLETGDVLWSSEGKIKGHINRFEAFKDFIYISTDKPFRFYALRPYNGEVIWTKPFKLKDEDALYQPTTINVFGDLVVYSIYPCLLCVFDRNSGKALWDISGKTEGNLAGFRASGNTFYIGTSNPGRLYAFDGKTGKTLWNSSGRIDGNEVRAVHISGNILYVEKDEAIIDKVTLVPTVITSLFAVDSKSGDVLWKNDGKLEGFDIDDIEEAGNGSSALFVWTGDVYPGTDLGYTIFNVLDKTNGKMLWGNSGKVDGVYAGMRISGDIIYIWTHSPDNLYAVSVKNWRILWQKKRASLLALEDDVLYADEKGRIGIYHINSSSISLPLTVDLNLKKAQTLYLSGKYEKALTLVNAAAELKPECQEALRLKEEIGIRTDDFRAVVQALDSLSDCSSEDNDDGVTAKSLYELAGLRAKKTFRHRIIQYNKNDSTLYALDSENTLHAVDVKSGRTVWESRLDIEGVASGIQISGNFVYIIAQRYLAEIDFASNNIYAVDGFSGKMRWKSTDKVKGQIIHYHFDDDAVYATTYKPAGISAIERRTGDILWRSLEGFWGFFQVFKVSGSLIYLISDEVLYTIDKHSGKLIWDTRQTAEKRIFEIQISDNAVFAHTGILSPPVLYALDGTGGELLWCFRGKKNEDIDKLKITDNSLYVLAKSSLSTETLFSMEYAIRVYAIDRISGAVRWKSEEINDTGMGDVQAHGEVLIANTGKNIHIINSENGNVLWNTSGKIEGEVEKFNVYHNLLITATSSPRHIYVFDVKSGEPKWDNNLTAGYGITGMTVEEDELAVAVNEPPALLSFKPDTGDIMWKYSFSEDKEILALLSGNGSLMALFNNYVYIFDEKKIRELRADGKKWWN
ncbi:MAG: PQQ-binding-like beta-propeller repeat protein [Candidatus Xenobiia bacterium LiM19]